MAGHARCTDTRSGIRGWVIQKKKERGGTERDPTASSLSFFATAWPRAAGVNGSSGDLLLSRSTLATLMALRAAALSVSSGVSGNSALKSQADLFSLPMGELNPVAILEGWSNRCAVLVTSGDPHWCTSSSCFRRMAYGLVSEEEDAVGPKTRQIKLWPNLWARPQSGSRPRSGASWSGANADAEREQTPGRPGVSRWIFHRPRPSRNSLVAHRHKILTAQTSVLRQRTGNAFHETKIEARLQSKIPKGSLLSEFQIRREQWCRRTRRWTWNGRQTATARRSGKGD